MQEPIQTTRTRAILRRLAKKRQVYGTDKRYSTVELIFRLTGDVLRYLPGLYRGLHCRRGNLAAN
jgi:hypothetical protein